MELEVTFKKGWGLIHMLQPSIIAGLRQKVLVVVLQIIGVLGN